MNTDDVVVGQEYSYLGQWVKVLEIHGQGDGAEAVVETRFRDLTTVPVSELEPK